MSLKSGYTEAGPSTTYSVVRRANCTLVHGQAPLDDMVALLSRASVGAVADMRVAKLAGAVMAFGLPEDLQALALELEAKTRERVNVDPRYRDLSAQACEWLASGERGLSSETIFSLVTGVHVLASGWGYSLPQDLGDLRRCRLLLEQCPDVAARFKVVMATQPAWQELVQHWDAICETMDMESPNWRTAGGKAPKAFAMLATVLENSDCRGQ